MDGEFLHLPDGFLLLSSFPAVGYQHRREPILYLAVIVFFNWRLIIRLSREKSWGLISELRELVGMEESQVDREIAGGCVFDKGGLGACFFLEGCHIGR